MKRASRSQPTGLDVVLLILQILLGFGSVAFLAVFASGRNSSSVAFLALGLIAVNGALFAVRSLLLSRRPERTPRSE